jgi:hypothetical protein
VKAIPSASLLATFMASAPPVPDWFEPQEVHRACQTWERERLLQWPLWWAREQIRRAESFDHTWGANGAFF